MAARAAAADAGKPAPRLSPNEKRRNANEKRHSAYKKRHYANEKRCYTDRNTTQHRHKNALTGKASTHTRPALPVFLGKSVPFFLFAPFLSRPKC